MPRPTRTSSDCTHQRGGVMMVMLVILVLGITTVFITSLSGTAMQNKRNQTTADALAKAKEALIGYAVSDPNRPGELPCPDTNDDGSAESNCSFGGGTLIGRLPWRTLDLPDPRDGASEKLWYIVSENFHANSTSPINSDTTGTISINGTADYAAVVLAPGTALPNQSRPNPPTGLNTSATYLQFLEDITQTTIQTQSPNDISGGAYTYNDQLLSLRPYDFMPLIERRIAREAKKCLDSYAASSHEKYPWAAPLNDSSYTNTTNTLFGHIPALPTSSDSGLSTQLNNLQNALNSLQSAVNACQTSDSTTNRNNLTNAGSALLTAMAAVTAPSSSALTSLSNYVNTAGNAAIPTGAGGSSYSNPCDFIKDNVGSVIETNLNNIAAGNYISTIASSTTADPDLQASWPAGCFQSGTYWDNWKSMVLYQLAAGYKPGTTTPACGATCLSITTTGSPNAGSGSYRAVIAMPGKKINPQTRATQTVDQYLEGGNEVNRSNVPTNLSFDTYRQTDSGYATVNDMAVCLDGNVNCQ